MDSCLTLIGANQHGITVGSNEGETALHCSRSPSDMVVRMREVLARPWVGLCAMTRNAKLAMKKKCALIVFLTPFPFLQFQVLRSVRLDPAIQRSTDLSIKRSNDPALFRSSDPVMQRSSDLAI